MNSVLIVGSGGREHALAWKLHRSPRIDQLYVAPGNAGTSAMAENIAIDATDVPALVRFVIEHDIGLTVIGPEAALAVGLADALTAVGRAVVGPTRAAFRLESSKAFAKEVMYRTGIPTAPFRVFDQLEPALRYVAGAEYPLVIKADGLAAGKGVTMCADADEAEAALRALMVEGIRGEAGRRVLIEQALHGREISLLALVDGEHAVPLPLAQDHKRLADGDTGPNTGGMGAFAPVPLPDGLQVDDLIARIIDPVVTEMARMGTPYRGILFAGLMLTAAVPMVLEFNCRLGDPETQVVLPLLDGDLYLALQATATGRLSDPIAVNQQTAVGIVLAAPGYPDDPQTGQLVEGLDQLPADVLCFHAGTARDDRGRLVTAGGRVVTVVGVAASRDEAAARAYAAPVGFPGMQRRSDIGRGILIAGPTG